MSFSAGYQGILPLSIAALQYRDIATESIPADSRNDAADRQSAHQGKHGGADDSESDFAARIREARIEAASQTELRLRQEYEQKLIAAREPITAAIKDFAVKREEYFTRVESEIVQLALSIAAKILHRESQIDPMLVASLVRLAVEKMREGSGVTVKVSPGRGASWKRYFAGYPNLVSLQVVEDPQISAQDCIVETELGSANFGLDAQLKEVEQGFCDLLAMRPATR